MSELFTIAEAKGTKRASVVFFHGLGGDAYATWRATADNSSFWPRWLAEDIQGLSVYSIGYEAPVSRWRGSAMHLTHRATNVLERLLAEPGLVIKQLLQTAESEARKREKATNFLKRVEKIAFLATPHTGSGWSTWGDRLRIAVRPSAAAASLVRNDPNLGNLNFWYRDWADAKNISHLILTETKSLRVLGMIVKADSRIPGFRRGRYRWIAIICRSPSPRTGQTKSMATC